MMEYIIATIFFVLCTVVATAVAWFFWRIAKNGSAHYAQIKDECDKWQQKHDNMQKECGTAKIASTKMIERAEVAQKNAEKLQADNVQLQRKTMHDAARIAELETKLQNAQMQANEKIKLLEAAQKNMNAEFEKTGQNMADKFNNLSQKILEEKSKTFSKDSKELLAPLQKDITTFSARINEIHSKETAARASLKTEVENLQKNAAQVGKDANNLALALKGDNKMQGNWGEMVLATLLEKSGLREGHEYETQQATRNEEGKLLRPDVIINLPDEKKLIVDSKVSLQAYNDYVNSDDMEQEQKALERHVRSVKSHVINLSSKHYADSKNVNAPDFVFMFMPIEPSFFVALNRDPNLFSFAYEKQIILCAPTTIMATLRTVARIWQIDKQNRNAEEIAKRGGALYDKFVGFIDSMGEIDTALGKARNAYDTAYKQLRTGKGNVFGQMDKLRALGINPKKRLSACDDGDDNNSVKY